MKAVLQNDFGGTETLFIGETENPALQYGQVMIEARTTALNRADILQRQGKYPPPKGESEVLGLEVAGVIIEIADGVPTEWQVDDKVMALLAGGGYASKVAVDYRLLMKIPENLSFVEAAAIPEVFLTAYQTLFLEGNAKPGETVLIHAGGSGVGTAAIQLAKAHGLKIAVTASAAKHETCLKLGADTTIDYKTQNFVDEVLEFTNQKGVNVILDFIGAPNFSKNINALAVEGRLVLIALMGGFKMDACSLLPFLQKRLQLKGTTLRARSIEYKAHLVSSFTKEFWVKLADGSITPIVDSIYPMEEVALAHQRMEENLNTGKIILTWV